jgi:hypothetical protein
MPLRASCVPSVPPPAPEPTMTTSPSSLRSNVAMGFGYEGASADKGGYIDRGFNDIDWLPKV